MEELRLSASQHSPEGINIAVNGESPYCLAYLALGPSSIPAAFADPTG
jgi:hypothetical protein